MMKKLVLTLASLILCATSLVAQRMNPTFKPNFKIVSDSYQAQIMGVGYRKVFSSSGSSGGGPCGTPGSISDNFAGTVNTPLASYNSCWVAWSSSYPISGCVLTGSGDVDPSGVWAVCGALYSGDTSSTSQITVAGSNMPNVGPVVHAIPGSATQLGYSIKMAGLSGGNYTRIELNGNSTYAFGGGTWSANVPHVLKIVAIGNSAPVTLKGYIDGVQVFSYQDPSSTPFISGYAGFAAFGDGVDVTDEIVSAYQDH